MTASRSCRLTIVASHPIQYFTPVYRRLAEAPGLDVEVLYCSDYGVRSRFDRQFARDVRWDTDQLSGYRHRFLRSISPVRDTFNPLHAINPGAFTRVLRDADAVWVNGYLYPSNWLASAAAALAGARVLMRSELRLDPDRPRRRLDAVRDRVIRHWVRRSDALLYIGQANRAAYVAYGATEAQLFFAPYSVDVERIESVTGAEGARRDALRRKWGIPPEPTVVLYVGKLTPRKHPEVMLRIAKLDARPAGVHVVFAGSGPEDGALRAEVARRELRNVSFLGFVNQTALPEVYAFSDVFVLPSEREPWGLVLNEAMAAGLAAVATDGVGAAPDLITPGETGYVVPTGGWDQLERQVATLAADPALRRRVGAAARERARRYSYEATAQGVLAALAALGAYRERAQGPTATRESCHPVAVRRP